MTAGGLEPARALHGAHVLVTGAGGLIGHALVSILADVPCTLRLFARRPVRAPAGRAAVEAVRADVRDAAAVRRALEGVDVVFHLAGQTSAAVADRDPEADRQVNVDPVLTILEDCRRRGGRPVIVLAGTDTQVGIPPTPVVDAATPDAPVTAYDAHKLMAEQYLELYARRGVVAGTCLRLPTVYGPGPRERAEDRGVVNEMIRRALAGGPLTVHGDGSPVRDFLHVKDAAAALLAAAVAIEALCGRHFSVGTGTGHTLRGAFELIARRVEAAAGGRVAVVSVPAPDAAPIERRSFVADSCPFRAATGWQAGFDLADGVDDTIAAYLAAGTPAVA